MVSRTTGSMGTPIPVCTCGRWLLILCLLLGLVVPNRTQECTAAETDTVQLTKDPTTAVLYSLALPGLGQYYTQDYWKIPLFTGVCATTIVLFFYNNNQYNTEAAAYNEAVAGGLSSAVIANLKQRREAFRDNRDISGAVFLTAYVLAAVDAYVGAHLYDFDVSDDLSVNIRPDLRTLAGLQVSVRW
ncbi:MAG: hypothetical protein D8M52_06035 [Chlorobi bacterium]|nr:MAG: hypothetical protein F9K28_08660 [Bacteroidota bacterium]KXK35594.1 MAG: hypothetical protein UZ06_CHB003000327 [Chlorobi bacterium OLB6]MBE2264678.1 hypothetical protein [Flavobacteriales bacterium]MBL1161263.1 hypothetical protein [Chlorobiota bacterium]MBW7854299.1 hypothetical protein [Candidatus Kapabacteria bacterium]MCC6332039.1 hypothetical protein [Ignavibacteria bacterium]